MIRLEFNFLNLFLNYKKEYIFIVEKFEDNRNIKKQVSCGQ